MTSACTAGRPACRPGRHATYFKGEIPRCSTRRLPRFVDEFVMGRIESEANLARLPDLATVTAIRAADRGRAALGRRAATPVRSNHRR